MIRCRLLYQQSQFVHVICVELSQVGALKRESISAHRTAAWLLANHRIVNSSTSVYLQYSRAIIPRRLSYTCMLAHNVGGRERS